MNATLSVQELWSQIRMLPAGERHWLANKLYDYDRSRANIKAGRVRTTEEVRRMIESKHPWLCE